VAVSITLRGILKKYGGKPALKNITLGVERSHVHAIIGPTGSGKSVLLRVMATLCMPDLGSGYINGLNLGARQNQIRHQIGYMAQYSRSEPGLTLLENLLLQAHLHGITIKDALARITGFADRFEIGEELKHFPEDVSLGTQRKTEFIRAILHNPSILLLDEPTASLDERSKRIMEEFLREQKNRFTTVMVSSNLPLVERLADRISILAEGQVVADGTLHELQISDQDNRVYDISLNSLDERDITVLDSHPGVISYAIRGGEYEVITAPEVTPEEILKLFLPRVTSFRPRNPSLQDLFVRIVMGEKANG